MFQPYGLVLNGTPVEVKGSSVKIFRINEIDHLDAPQIEVSRQVVGPHERVHAYGQ